MNLLFFFLLALSHIPGIENSGEVSSLERRRGDDVVFRLDRTIGNDTHRIVWILNSEKLILAIISLEGNSTDWIIPHKEYKERLSLHVHSLMLSNLTIKDSGCYEADINSVLGGITTQKFNLTVLETETKSNMNKWIVVAVVIPVRVFVILIIACVFYLRSRGTYRSCIRHTEENVPEEGYQLSPMASLPVNEQRLSAPETLSAITLQED